VERGSACGYSGNADASADTRAFEAQPVVVSLGSLHGAHHGALRQCLRSLTRRCVDRAVVDVARLIQPVWYREGKSAARGGEREAEGSCEVAQMRHRKSAEATRGTGRVIKVSWQAVAEPNAAHKMSRA
jgi:hypothetical protein